jgi:hypothetical protein
MMRFLFAARPVLEGQDSETGKSPPGKRFRARCWRCGGRFQSLKRYLVDGITTGAIFEIPPPSNFVAG